MRIAIIVEGVSDKIVLQQVLLLLQNKLKINKLPPIRAGHAQYQGEALLDYLSEIIKLQKEEKVIVLVDSNRKEKANKFISNTQAASNKKVCILVAPWEGIETFVKENLNRQDQDEFQKHHGSGFSKRKIAEIYASRLNSEMLKKYKWLDDVFIQSLKCKCPQGTTLAHS